MFIGGKQPMKSRQTCVVAALCSVGLSTAAFGQLGRIEECLPIPSYGRELSEYREELRQRNASPQVQIREVSFETQNYLPQTVKDQLATTLKNLSFDSDSDWLREVEERTLETWQEHGYFKALVSGRNSLLASADGKQRFAVLLVVNEGPQYRLGGITFSPSKVSTASELRKAFPLQEGEIVDIAKLRAGIERLRKLYGAKGYINFTGVPDIIVDEGANAISVKIDLDEGKVYRISEIKVLGLDQAVAARLLRKSKIVRGEPYNYQLVEEFFRTNKSFLPADASFDNNGAITRNDSAGTVSLLFDFRQCPGTPSRAAVSQKP
jgi:outer membrane protein assembly factor BamA